MAAIILDEQKIREAFKNALLKHAEAMLSAGVTLPESLLDGAVQERWTHFVADPYYFIETGCFSLEALQMTLKDDESDGSTKRSD